MQSAIEGVIYKQEEAEKKTLGAGMQSSYRPLKLKIEVCVKLGKRIVFRESENHQ